MKKDRIRLDTTVSLEDAIADLVGGPAASPQGALDRLEDACGAYFRGYGDHEASLWNGVRETVSRQHGVITPLTLGAVAAAHKASWLTGSSMAPQDCQGLPLKNFLAITGVDDAAQDVVLWLEQNDDLIAIDKALPKTGFKMFAETAFAHSKIAGSQSASQYVLLGSGITTDCEALAKNSALTETGYRAYTEKCAEHIGSGAWSIDDLENMKTVFRLAFSKNWKLTDKTVEIFEIAIKGGANRWSELLAFACVPEIAKGARFEQTLKRQTSKNRTEIAAEDATIAISQAMSYMDGRQWLKNAHRLLDIIQIGRAGKGTVIPAAARALMRDASRVAPGLKRDDALAMVKHSDKRIRDAGLLIASLAQQPRRKGRKQRVATTKEASDDWKVPDSSSTSPAAESTI